MDNAAQDALRFPIGRFAAPSLPPSREAVESWIDGIEALPAALRAATEPLTDEQLDTAYRAGGWSLRQVVHHVADSHMNSFVRFKWALTEEEPTIKAYDEKRWAELGDYVMPVGPSLDHLDATHCRWVELLRSMSDKDFERGFHHPEHGGHVQLHVNTAVYDWHGRHHLGQITQLLDARGWSEART